MTTPQYTAYLTPDSEQFAYFPIPPEYAERLHPVWTSMCEVLGRTQGMTAEDEAACDNWTFRSREIVAEAIKGTEYEGWEVLITRRADYD